MGKIKIELSQLEQIDEPRQTLSPKDLLIEQENSYNDDGSYRHLYKCPCGKGQVIDEYDGTPGFRDHYKGIQCGECNEKYEIK